MFTCCKPAIILVEAGKGYSFLEGSYGSQRAHAAEIAKRRSEFCRVASNLPITYARIVGLAEQGANLHFAPSRLADF
jgi:hypothetical protein